MKMYEVFRRQVEEDFTIKLLLSVCIFGNMLWIPRLYIYIYMYVCAFIYIMLYIMCVDISIDICINLDTAYPS